MKLKNILLFFIVFGMSVSTSYASWTDWNASSILIGKSERNYHKEIKGDFVVNTTMKKLPIVRGKPNFICLKKRGKKIVLSKEIVFLWPKDKDSDGDGLSDLDEAELGTNPNKPDTDKDGLLDGAESILWGEDATEDYDGDGLSNILDFDSFESGSSDKNNPDLREMLVVVINENNTPLLMDCFNEIVFFKNIILNKNNSTSIHLDGKDMEGFRFYYRAIDRIPSASMTHTKSDYNGRGFYQGDSPIDMGDSKDIKLYDLDISKIYQFAGTAYDSNEESTLYYPPLYNIAISVIHKYPDKDIPLIFWQVQKRDLVNARERDGYELFDVFLDGKSIGIKPEVNFIAKEPGHKITFIYQEVKKN